MKKLLALVLALVMTLGLATVGANAALSDYKDEDTIKYREAAAVVQATGIMVGDNQGYFKGTETLKRSEAAKIVTYLMLGNKAADVLRGSGNRFTDVAADAWYAGYVEYCAANGIIAGMGNGTFQPDGQLTATAFAKMLIVALGYDPKLEGLEGSDWSINTQKIANQVGLFDGNPNVVGSANVTRDEAALYTFNTLCTPLVQYDSTVNVTVNGAAVVVGNNNAKFVTTVDNTGRYTNIDDLKDNTNRQANIVEFAEEYYQKLVREYDDVDVFGRPAHVWTYDKKEIGTFVNDALLVKSYTDSVSGKELYNLLGKSVVEDFDIDVYQDGIEVTTADILSAIAKKNDGDWYNTDTGVLTEVYVDNDYEEVTIVLINTYLAIASGDYNKKNETVGLDIYGVRAVNDELVRAAGAKASVKLEKDDFALVEDIAEDDAFLVTVADGEVQSIAKAKVDEDTTVNGFNTVKKKITVDGTQYSKAATAQYDAEVLSVFTGGGVTNLKDTTYDIYFDTYGNVIGVAERTATKNYAFVTAVNGADDDFIAKKNGKANLIFLDGTSKVVEFNANKSTNFGGGWMRVNCWVTYTVNSSDVYTLKAVSDVIDTANNIKEAQSVNPIYVDEDDEVGALTYDIDSKHVSLIGATEGVGYSRVYGNNSTVYLTADLDTLTYERNSWVVITGASAVTTGIGNANFETYTAAEQLDEVGDANAEPLAYSVYTLYKSNGYVVAAVVVGDDASASKDIVYAKSGVNYESYDAKADEWTWSADVYKDGELVTIKEKGSDYDELAKIQKNHWYRVSYNAAGFVVKVEPFSYDDNGYGQFKPTTDPAYAVGYDAAALGENNTIAKIIDKADTLVYQEGRDSVPSLKGQTLYLDKASMDDGFRVASNVKVVLYQWVNNKDKWTVYEGISELESVLDALNENADGKYDITFNAKIDDGVSKFIVIIDGVKNYTGRPVPTTGNYYLKAVLQENGADYKVFKTSETPADFDTTAQYAKDAGLAAIMADVKDRGYSNMKATAGINGVTAAGWTVTGEKYVSGNIVTGTFYWDGAFSTES